MRGASWKIWTAVVGTTGALLGSVHSHADSAASSLLNTLEIVAATSPSDSATAKFVTAYCPPNKLAFSGGAEVSPAVTGVALQQSMSVGDPPDGWTAYALETEPSSAPWSVRAYALCATIPGYVVVREGLFPDSDHKVVTLYCPRGLHPIGGGAGILLPNPDTALVSSGLLTGAAGSTPYFAVAREIRPSAEAWAFLASLSCAPLPESFAITLGQPWLREVAVSCGSGNVALSGGNVLLLDYEDGAAMVRSSPVGPVPSPVWRVTYGEAGTGVFASASVVCLGEALFADGFDSGTRLAWE